MKTFVDVIVPLPVAGLFTYSLPESLENKVMEGSRVVVQFGVRKFYTAIVVRIHHTAPEGVEAKDIFELVDSQPILLRQQYEQWQWIADYYLCPVGEVYKAAIPSGMKIESETLVALNDEYEETEPLSPKERHIIDSLSEGKEQSIQQLGKQEGLKNLLPTINNLLAKGAVVVKEELRRSYKPKVEIRVRLTPRMRNEHALHIQLDMLARAEKQQVLLLSYLFLSGWNASDGETKEISREELLHVSQASPAALKALVDKQILEQYQEEIGRLSAKDVETQSVHPLSEAQQRAYDEIQETFRQKNICLLHGITGSGKTEIYIHLIQEAVQRGRQVLYLLPEIALTAQITNRLRRVFGNRLGVYHSKFPDAERVEIWRKQLSDAPYDVILGVRSSVFLPFRNLGLVIVDEEHEASYKQQDPAPRYHARSVAVVLAQMFGAKTLLGTATPSIETYYNATQGKYGLVRLMERHKQIQLPLIEVVDIKELARKKMMTGRFSPLLLQKIHEALDQKEQVILFQNRRGFAPMVECRTCGWVPKCKNCDVSLTYHKASGQLTCHYCGYTYAVPQSCPACGETQIVSRGFGTEKIEDEIRSLIPEAKVARMDLDTTRARSAYERIISDFENGKTDILIGTQMVSKGLDFDRVSVVGILNADSMLNFPDFRSYERAFQLMAQVAGRAGRKNKQGLVVLQTKSPELPLIHQVVANDYGSLYESQMEERSLFRYPPFHRLIYVYVKHRKEDVLEQAAAVMAGYLRAGMGERVLGPDRPPVARVQMMFIRKIVLKIEQGASMGKVREFLRQVQTRVREDERFRSVMVYYDVDPM